MSIPRLELVSHHLYPYVQPAVITLTASFRYVLS